ncbi:MAG: lysoplasmalogenase [Daejeonella sp.]|uniref:lysoplasmalogenase n=1 Tax=Daejeonella sp. TaxID=2805397 RepID=UPI00273567F4|nr:lysoplasmalogenase [Daejeonella sp.]MDP3467337.1 lysoplasmalogenase [Daejeonella sp.]
MFKRHTIFSLIFFMILILNLLVQSTFFEGYAILIKPLICISLAFYLYKESNMKAGFNRLVFAGLLFSLMGDILLLYAASDVYFFLYGLVSFLIAHILYSSAFFRDFKNNPQESKYYGHLMLFFMGVFSMSYYSWIRDYLNDFRIPVLAYIFVISIMAILAGYRYRRVNLLSFRLVCFGAVFFVISDSALAFNKFVQPYSFAGILIMSTYMIAQYMITIGTIERKVVGKTHSDK